MAFSGPTDAYTASDLAAMIPRNFGYLKLVLIDLEPQMGQQGGSVCR